VNGRRFVQRLIALAILVSLGFGLVGCSTLFGGGDEKPKIRRVAILPFGYRTPGENVACTLCPDTLVMANTSHDDAMLVTAFFHEAMTTYPGLSILPFETVERFQGTTMSETMDRLYAMEEIDAVLVGALMELRPREGDPRTPTAPAGAAVYAALVEPLTERVLWSGYRDEDQEPPPITIKRMSDILSGVPVRWLSDLGQAQVYAEQLTKEMVKRIR
jgi:hypothetical protein